MSEEPLYQVIERIMAEQLNDRVKLLVRTDSVDADVVWKEWLRDSKGVTDENRTTDI